MPTVVTDPLGGLLGGMVQGYQLAHQIKQQAMQEEAFQREKAKQDREMNIQDIRTRMMLDQNARPIQAGTVQDQLPAAPEVAGQPTMQGGNPQIPIVRPVDKSRRVSYKGRDGQTQDYELLSPEEQIKKQVESATAMKHAGSTLINTPEHLQKLGLPAQVYVPDEHLYQYAQTTNQTQPIETPQVFRDMGGPAQVPLSALPSVTSTVNSAMNRKDTNDRAEKGIKSREKLAADAEGGRNKRAADANATRLKAAGMRRDQPTPGQQGVENRFQQRQLESDQKALRDLEGKKDALWAEVEQWRSAVPGKNDDKAQFEQRRRGMLAGLDLRIKGNAETRQKLIDKWQSKGGMPQPEAPAAASGVAPRARTGGAPAAPAGREGPISVNLPNGKVGHFPNQAALDSWLKDNGLSLQER